MITSFSCSGWGPFENDTTLNFGTDNNSEETFESNGRVKRNRITAIFGPNNSGKTMILRGISALREITLGKRSPAHYKGMVNRSFDGLAKLELGFTFEGHQYRYSISFDPRTDRITDESGIVEDSNDDSYCFLDWNRDSDEIHHEFMSKSDLPQIDLKATIRSHSLVFETFLTYDERGIYSDDSITKHILNIHGFFERKILFSVPEINQISNKNLGMTSAILKHFDTGIDRIIHDRNDDQIIARDSYSIIHTGCNHRFSLLDESEGTLKLIEYASILSNGDEGRTILVDEIDRKLHPNAVREILRMFMYNADGNQQLIFTTHLSSLISPDIIGPGDILIIDSRDDGFSKVVCLEDDDIGFLSESDYLAGKYGGIPRIGD